MTIHHVYFNEDSDGERLFIERDYEHDTVKIVVDNYGEQESITLPCKDFFELMRSAGLGS